MTIKKSYVIIACVYLFTMIPSYFYLNKFMIIGIPLLTTVITLYLLRNEYFKSTLHDIFQNEQIKSWTQIGFASTLIVNIGFNILFLQHSNISVPVQLITEYPIAPIYMLVNAPIVEEVVFRKILFKALDKKFNFYVGAIISSVLFGALHNNIALFLLYFIIGLIFCYIYKKSGSIIPSMTNHIIINLIVILNTSLNI